MVIPPTEDHDNWLKFASLCRKSGNMRLSFKTLQNLNGGEVPVLADMTPSPRQPRVTFAFLKHMWDAGDQAEAFECLRAFTNSTLGGDTKLLARCHLSLGQWETELNDTLSEVRQPDLQIAQSLRYCFRL
jgi:FKBP12-rapamycin complex-associated protein